MTIAVFERQVLTLDSQRRRKVLSPIDVPARTSSIQILIARPTSLDPRAWGSADTMKVSAILDVDGSEHRYSGQATGGIRKNRLNEEMAQYSFKFTPTWGFFGERTGNPRRLGELSKMHYRLRLEIDALAGNLDTEIEVLLDELAARRIAFHSSVAFDAATGAQEVGGDNVVSLSHTATGADRAAFIGTGCSSSAGGTGAVVTYAGNATTELWDAEFQTFYAHSGAYIKDASMGTGAQPVVFTASGGLAGTTTEEQGLGVISVTGVDQTTSVGTHTANSGSSANPSITVNDVVADGLVVSNFYGEENPAVGANETQAYEEDVAGVFLSGSYQASGDGGVVSRTAANNAWGLGGIEFKPAAGGDVDAVPQVWMQYRSRTVH